MKKPELLRRIFSTTKLKPCGCGGMPALVEVGTHWQICCYGCGIASKPRLFIGDAESDWNTAMGGE